jgi:hypothetical protein
MDGQRSAGNDACSRENGGDPADSAFESTPPLSRGFTLCHSRSDKVHSRAARSHALDEATASRKRNKTLLPLHDLR